MASDRGKIRAYIHPQNPTIGHIEHGSLADIQAAEAWLRSKGCTVARGPMGPDTWQPYRATTHSFGRPTFLGEPRFNADIWRQCGYSPIAEYTSALAQNIPAAQAAAAASCPLVTAGFDVLGLDAHESFDAALSVFHGIATAAFKTAFAYSPIDLQGFRALYSPIKSMIEPKMVLTAFDPNGRPIGFCFNIPDRLNPERKEFIVKSLAVLPEHHRTGIGSWLVGVSHSMGHSLGWTGGGIHALMWTHSHSRAISAHTGEVIRRHALFEKVL